MHVCDFFIHNTLRDQLSKFARFCHREHLKLRHHSVRYGLFFPSVVYRPHNVHPPDGIPLYSYTAAYLRKNEYPGFLENQSLLEQSRVFLIFVQIRWHCLGTRGLIIICVILLTSIQYLIAECPETSSSASSPCSLGTRVIKLLKCFNSNLWNIKDNDDQNHPDVLYCDVIHKLGEIRKKL